MFLFLCCVKEPFMPQETSIRVISFDFDECLFNKSYKNKFAEDEMDYGMGTISDENSALITTNKTLLQSLRHYNNKYSKTISFIGSSNQSNQDEARYMRRNKNTSESQFSAINTVSNYIGAEVDTMLMADIYSRKDPGFSYKAANTPNYKGKHPEWDKDDSKVAMIYAQIHKIANENPGENITFDFIEHDIALINALKIFFEKNSGLIPSNVLLRIHPYYHQSSNPLDTLASKNSTLPHDTQYTPKIDPKIMIKGTGTINKEYQSTVREMFNLASQCKKEGEKSLHVDRIDPKKLKQRQLINPNTAVAPSKVFDLKELLFEIKWKANKFELAGNKEAYTAAITLHKNLTNLLNEFNAIPNPTSTDIACFENKAHSELTTAHKVLDKNRGWLTFLGSFSASIHKTGSTVLLHKFKQELFSQANRYQPSEVNEQKTNDMHKK